MKKDETLPSKRPSAEKIIIFTRYPEPGKTKTRLIPVLGPAAAAELQRRMTEHVLARVRNLALRRDVALQVCYEGGKEALLRSWLGSHLSYCPQHSGDLGTRMQGAFNDAFMEGRERVLIVGTDCPDLDDKLLEKAFEDLRDHDLVLGPARDGGYYLIGMKQPCPSIFHDMPWGTSEVLTRTVEVAYRNELSVGLLELRDDVDRPEDVKVWDRNREADRCGLGRQPHLRESEMLSQAPATITVIIPTLNEGAFLAATMDTVLGYENVEVIVADGGSSDQTIEVARAYNVTTIEVPSCRAAQMNSGAQGAHGEILLFLHADTHLPKDWANHVRNEMRDPGTAGGAFLLKIDVQERWSRIIEWLANIRSRRLHMPYGDQAIFLRADLFREMCGFQELPIMEDFELMRRLHKRGRIGIISEPVITSARRWKALGVWWTTVVNQLVILGYFLGVPPHFLARFYHFKEHESVSREAPKRKSCV